MAHNFILSSTFQSDRDALQNIHKIASSIASQLNDVLPIASQPLPPSPPSFPALAVHVPPHVLDPISTLSISESTRYQLLQVIKNRVEQLQQQYTASYNRACQDVAKGPNPSKHLGSIHQVYEALSRRHFLPTIQSWVTFIVTEANKRGQSLAHESKQPFNNLFLPTLEKYFEYNWYPSLAHRSILAQSSSMSTRQIEVWFQNHRKRARQDKKIAQRLDSEIPLKMALSVFSKDMPLRHTRMPTPVDDMSFGDDTDGEGNVSKDRLPVSVLEKTKYTEIRPPHAYPTRRNGQYPDPFLTEKGVFKFPPPAWRRKPATIPIIPTVIDMDDFTKQFHIKLTFVNTSCKRENTPSKADIQSFSPWFAPFRTIPLSAPLAALQQPRSSTPVLTSMLSSIAMDPFTFEFTPKPQEVEESSISCVVRLPFGPQQSVSSITERIDRSVEALDRERKVFRKRRRGINSPKPPNSCLASPGEIAGRKGSPTSRRTPSSLQTVSSRTSSFSSEISSSSDDSSSPTTPAPLPDQELFSDLFVQSEDNTVNYDNYFDFSPSQPFDFSFTKSTDDLHSSALFQNHSPLIFT